MAEMILAQSLEKLREKHPKKLWNMPKYFGKDLKSYKTSTRSFHKLKRARRRFSDEAWYDRLSKRKLHVTEPHSIRYNQ